MAPPKKSIAALVIEKEAESSKSKEKGNEQTSISEKENPKQSKASEKRQPPQEEGEETSSEGEISLSSNSEIFDSSDDEDDSEKPILKKRFKILSPADRGIVNTTSKLLTKASTLMFDTNKLGGSVIVKFANECKETAAVIKDCLRSPYLEINKDNKKSIRREMNDLQKVRKMLKSIHEDLVAEAYGCFGPTLLSCIRDGEYCEEVMGKKMISKISAQIKNQQKALKNLNNSSCQSALQWKKASAYQSTFRPQKRSFSTPWSGNNTRTNKYPQGSFKKSKGQSGSGN